MTAKTSKAKKKKTTKKANKPSSKPAPRKGKKSTKKKAVKPVKKTAKKPSQKRVQKGKKKGKSRKGILITALVLVILLAAGITYILTNLEILVKMAIEKYGSQATQTAVRVSSVEISLKEGSCSMELLTVGNPKGFDLKHAFSLGKIGVDINPKSLTKEEIGIDDIVVRALEIFVEVNKDKKTNLNEIKNNLPKGSGAPSKSKEPKKKSKEKQLFIRRILFETGQIYARVVPMDNKEYQLKLGRFEMRNLRGTPKQIAMQVMKRLTNQALSEVKKSGVGQAMDRYGDKAKSQLESEKKKALDKAKKTLGL